MFRLFLFFAVLIFPLQPAWAKAANDSFHVLKGRIIRSLAIEMNDPDHNLVGQKAKSPGLALVFQSLDGGRSWRTLNDNTPLNPDATDVQAVLAESKNSPACQNQEARTLYFNRWRQTFYTRPPVSIFRHP